MPISERAKQFLSFQALRGFDKDIDVKNKIICERKELSEDDLSILSDKIKRVSKGKLIRITYYLDNAYITKEGLVSDIDFIFRKLTLIKTLINFDDILDVELLQ